MIVRRAADTREKERAKGSGKVPTKITTERSEAATRVNDRTKSSENDPTGLTGLRNVAEISENDRVKGCVIKRVFFLSVSQNVWVGRP